jgi:hypothetical protein
LDGHRHAETVAISTLTASAVSTALTETAPPIAKPDPDPLSVLPVLPASRKTRKKNIKKQKRFRAKRTVAETILDKKTFVMPHSPEPTIQPPGFDKCIRECMRICEKASWRHCFKKNSESMSVWGDRREDAAAAAMLAMIQPANIKKLLEASPDERRLLACTIAKRRVMDESTRAYVRRNISASSFSARGDCDYDPSADSLESQSVGEILDGLRDGTTGYFSEEDLSEAQSMLDDPKARWLFRQYDTQDQDDILADNYLKHLQSVFDDAIATALTKDEGLCVQLRFGLGPWTDFRGMRQYDEVAGCLRILGSDKSTVSRVKRLMKSALGKLKAYLQPLLFHPPALEGPATRINARGRKVRQPKEHPENVVQ